MKASDEIDALEPPERAPYQRGDEFKFGFHEARREAVAVAFRHELDAQRMARALESIELNSKVVRDILGEDAVFNIRYALKAYREQQYK